MNGRGEHGRPLRIAHVIYRLGIGGMENGLVNLINTMPRERFEHRILCLTHATEFRSRIARDDVVIGELHKPEGNDFRSWYRAYRTLGDWRPDIVHTRNLGTLDLNWAALLARCPRRIHGEHGWDAADPAGASRKYRYLRRVCDRAVHRYVAVSDDIRRWLGGVIGISDAKITQIYNGVDTKRFSPEVPALALPVATEGRTVFGTLGRQDAIKGLATFLDAVRRVVERRPERRDAITVVLAGDGPENARLRSLAQQHGLESCTYLPGNVDDVPGLLGCFDFFVQPSLNEGISNTILEARAAGLAVICTGVGGNPELVAGGRDGLLVAPRDPGALADAIEYYIDHPAERGRHGEEGRARVERDFSLEAMSRAYAALYEQVDETTKHKAN